MSDEVNNFKLQTHLRFTGRIERDIRLFADTASAQHANEMKC